MQNYVITIARSCGSGGILVGKLLAKKLGIEYYDSRLLRLASDDSGISEELFASADEKLQKTLLFKAARKAYKGELIPPENSDFTSSKNLFNYQAKVIRSLAYSGPCIIIGRCGEMILEDHPGLFSVFISASNETCAKNEAKNHDLSEKAAYERVDRINKYRADYHKYYTGKTWGHPGNYDLCLSTDAFTPEQCCDIIVSAMNVKLGK